MLREIISTICPSITNYTILSSVFLLRPRKKSSIMMNKRVRFDESGGLQLGMQPSDVGSLLPAREPNGKTKDDKGKDKKKSEKSGRGF